MPFDNMDTMWASFSPLYEYRGARTAKKEIIHLYMNKKEKRKLHLCMNHQGSNPLTVELLELCVKCPATVGAPKYMKM